MLGSSQQLSLFQSRNENVFIPVTRLSVLKRTEREKKYLKSANKVERITKKLGICGNYYTKDKLCKHCRSEMIEEVVEKGKKQLEYHCTLKICSNPNCKSAGWGTMFEKLKNTWRLQSCYGGLKELNHFCIGFEKIGLWEYKDKVQKQKKLVQEFFKLVNKEMRVVLQEPNFSINAIAVHDISKGSRKLSPDGKYYSHYHFGIIPFKGIKGDKFLKACHKVRNIIVKRKHKGYGLKIEEFGMRNLNRILSYFTLRASGLYKPYETPDIETYDKKALVEGIKNKEFMLLSDIMSIEQYANTGYNVRNIWTIGKQIKLGNLVKNKDLLESNIVMDEVINKIQCKCPRHGILGKEDIIHRMVFLEKVETPPDIVTRTIYGEERVSLPSIGGYK